MHVGRATAPGCKFAVNARCPALRGRTAGRRRRTTDAVQTADTATPARVREASGTPPPELALDRYRLVRRIGSGAFGVVWLAHDVHLDRVVAVKRIETHDEQIAARAEREAHAAARLSHPAIVALHEAGRDADALYLVSELVRGHTLADLTEAGALSDRDIVRIGAALCDALEHAHERGVVHRDMKPANVMVPDNPLGEAGIAKLTDFGVARIAGDSGLTRTGDVVGTLAYMAPEQAEGLPVTGAADLYALALVLYEALSGVNPIRAHGAAETVRRVGARLPPLRRLRPDLPRPVTGALDRALLPHPDDRGTLAELREALDESLEEADRTVGPVAASRAERLVTGEHEIVAPLPWTAGEHLSSQDVRGGPAPRLIAAGAAGMLIAAVLTAAPPGLAPAGGSIVLAALAAAALVALLPRAGWLLAATALVAWLAATGLPGLGIVLAAAVIPVALLLPGAGALWSAPAGAPILGLAGLALAWPALAGQARTAERRVALGALGLWWLLLAEPVLRPALFLGDVPGTPPAHAWEGSVAGALTDVLGPILASGAPLVAVVWALAALVLPALVRGRRLLVDLVLVTGWAAGVASATGALAAALPWPGMQPEPRGLAAGAVAGAAAALLGAALRQDRTAARTGHPGGVSP